MAKIMVQCGRPSRSSWATVRSSFGRTVMGMAIWENPIAARLVEGFQLGMLIRTPWQRIILICVDDIKLAGRKHNIDPMWNVLNKEVDLGDSTSFLDHEDLVCTQTQWKKQRYCWQVQNHVWIQNFRRSNWKITRLGKSAHLFVVLRYHAKKCVERNCELASKTTQQLYKVSTPCIDDHHFKEEKSKSVGELSKVCSQIVLKCLYLARVGGPDVLWSVNKLARSITKWTKACDNRLIRLISYIHHTCEYKQYCYVGNTAKQCCWDCFKTPILQEILRIQNLRQVQHCAFLEVIRLFQSVGCARNKRQFRTVQPNQKSFLLDAVLRLEVSPHLIYGILSSQFLETRIRVETRWLINEKFVQRFTRFNNKHNLKEWSMIWTMSILSRQTSILLVRKLKFVCVWRQWSGDQNDY